MVGLELRGSRGESWPSSSPRLSSREGAQRLRRRFPKSHLPRGGVVSFHLSSTWRSAAITGNDNMYVQGSLISAGLSVPENPCRRNLCRGNPMLSVRCCPFHATCWGLESLRAQLHLRGQPGLRWPRDNDTLPSSPWEVRAWPRRRPPRPRGRVPTRAAVSSTVPRADREGVGSEAPCQGDAALPSMSVAGCGARSDRRRSDPPRDGDTPQPGRLRAASRPLGPTPPPLGLTCSVW